MNTNLLPYTQPNGVRFTENKVSSVSPEYTGVGYGGNAIWLNGTDQYVDLNIEHQLGFEEMASGDFGGGSDVTVTAISNACIASLCCLAYLSTEPKALSKAISKCDCPIL